MCSDLSRKNSLVERKNWSDILSFVSRGRRSTIRSNNPMKYCSGADAVSCFRRDWNILDDFWSLLQEDLWHVLVATDVRLRIVEELLSSEKDYCHTLKTVADLYEKPLRKLLSMEKEDYKSLFDWVEPICSLSKMVIIKAFRSGLYDNEYNACVMDAIRGKV
ncbi:DH domain-containing protein [Trichonephila clavata]|uniref:DH domain-containing protein n=1 Tax=Trichonephila clavata TaxID=2740835 RepID=A0A8X6I2Y7_TRICU|nr:DH domain-containing protein [Trichonephila clavata]